MAFHLLAAPLCVFSFSTTGVVENVNICMGDLAKARADRMVRDRMVNMSRVSLADGFVSRSLVSFIQLQMKSSGRTNSSTKSRNSRSVPAVFTRHFLACARREPMRSALNAVDDFSTLPGVVIWEHISTPSGSPSPCRLSYPPSHLPFRRRTGTSSLRAGLSRNINLARFIPVVLSFDVEFTSSRYIRGL